MTACAYPMNPMISYYVRARSHRQCRSNLCGGGRSRPSLQRFCVASPCATLLHAPMIRVQFDRLCACIRAWHALRGSTLGSTCPSVEMRIISRLSISEITSFRPDASTACGQGSKPHHAFSLHTCRDVTADTRGSHPVFDAASG